MTALLDQETEPPTATDDVVRHASWAVRACALLLDVLPGVAVVTTMALLANTAARGAWQWWVFTGVAVVATLATLVDRLILPSTVGWTLGRAVTGIRVTTVTGHPVGGVRLLGREAAHLLDTATLFVGWLWPLADRRRRTFADLLSRSEVRVVDADAAPSRDVRRAAGCVLVAAAVVCAAGSGLGYLEVYRQDRAVAQARSQITEQGPRIVEQLLSYGTRNVVDDFARAQALATDEYRPLLIAQQQAVQKAGITDNEYWAVSSAVLSATADRAAMLLALQGQRGSDPNTLRFITATVRADFEKVDDKWEVAVLTVLKKPQTNQQASEPRP